MKGNKTSKNIQTYMFHTYFWIAMIAAVLGCIIYIYMFRNARSYMETLHETSLNNLTYQIDMELGSVRTQTNSLGQNSKVTRILSIHLDGAYFGEQMEKVKEAMDLFENVMSFYPAIEEIMLLDVGQDTAVTQASIYHEEKYEQYLKEKTGVGEEELLSLLKGISGDTLLISPGSSACQLYYVKKIYGSSYKTPDGYLLAEVSMDQLAELLSMFSGKSGEIYLLANQEGVCLGDGESQEMLTAVLESGKAGQVSIEGRRYVYSSVYSEESQLEVFYVSSYFTFYEVVISTLLMIALNLAILLVVSAFFAKRFARENSRPIREIMRMLKAEVVPEEAFTYDTVLHEASEVSKKLEAMEDRKKKEQFSMILMGHEKNESVILAIEKEYKDWLENGIYVLEISIRNLSELSEFDILMFCINNVFSEALGELLLGAPVESWGRVYFLLKKEKPGVQEKIMETMAFLENRLSMTVIAGISEVKHSFLELREARWETDCMIEYAELAGIFNQPVLYGKVMGRDTGKKNPYPEKLKKWIHLVLAKDYIGCKKLLENPECMEGEIHYSAVRGNRQQMLSLLSIISIPYQEKMGKIDYERFEKKGIRELYQVILEMLDALIDQAEPEKTGSKTLSEIKNYICLHAKDSGLSVGEISSVFHLTPSYLSRIFKKETGEGVLDYIHRCRISRGKELLKEGKTVQETALLVGYIDARGFIRSFKRYEGITPGQFKNMQE